MDVTYYEIASEIRSGVDIADRKYHLSTYENCFVGKEAVDFLLTKGYAGTHEEAVQLGQSIMTETKLFFHVCCNHSFADTNLFYHFIQRGEVSLKESMGEKFDWKDYVAASQLESDAGAVSGMQP